MILREFVSGVTRQALRDLVYFSLSYNSPLKLIHLLVLKMLISVRYECYGIGVENT